MKILMILSNPFMVDPRVYKEAKSLVNAGHEVNVIVWDRKRDYEPEKTVDGIKIIRIHNEGIMKILPNDLFRNRFWWRRAYKKGLELYKNDFKFDVVHCHDLDTLQSGVYLKKKLGMKLIYDAHEIFGYMIARNLPKFIVNYAFNMEKKLVKNVDFVITAEETYNDYFKSLGCNSIVTILNCKDIIEEKYQHPINEIFTIVYIGILNQSRFFPENLEVIGNMEDVKFIIAGKKENMYDDIEKLSKKYDNIEFLGAIPFHKVIPYTFKANVVLCMINPDDINNRIASANKQFEAMVCGRAIICTKGVRSGEITAKEKCGLVVNYSKDSLREAIVKLRDSPELCEKFGRNALNAAIGKYNWGTELKKLLNLYKKIEMT